MKRFVIFAIFAIIFFSVPAWSANIKVVDGTDGWNRNGNIISVENPDQDIIEINNVNIAEDSNWQTVVGQVTGVWGVHLHTVGVTSCQVIDRNGATVKIGDCINHKQGEEFEVLSSEFPNLTSISPPYSSTFVSISSTTVILADTFTTDEQLKTRIPLGRVQQTVNGGFSIIDLRPIVSEKDRLDYTFRRELFGPAVGIDGGLVVTEVVGVPRTLNITTGKFGDERGQVHALPAFNSLTGLTIWTTTPDPSPNITAVRGLLTVDNINYNNRVTGGLTPAQNNNKWIYMDLVASPSGGVIDGIDSGRAPTWFLFYGTGEFDSETAARNAPIDLSIFGNSKPKLLNLWRLLLRKNQTNIESFFDLRPFFGQPAGVPAAIQATIDLQGAYDLSPNGGTPEIKTNDIQEDLTIQYEGTNGKILELWKADNEPVFTVWTSGVILKQKRAVFKDIKSSGVDGGACIAGNYVRRTLNTTAESATFANLSSNGQISLKSGTYWANSSAPFFFTNGSKARIQNDTDDTTLEIGTSEYAQASTIGVSRRTYVRGRFTIPQDKVISLQQRCQTTKTINGFGVASGFGDAETYTQVILIKED